MTKKELNNKLSELIIEMGYSEIAKDIKRGYKVKESLQLALNLFKSEHKNNPQIERFCQLYLKLL